MGSGERLTAALRSGDRHVVDRVRRLCVLAGARLEVVGPGGEPLDAEVLLDDRGDPVGAAWRDLLPGVEVVELGSGPGALGLPAEDEALLELLSRAATPRRARTVGVLGAGGGVGASVLAAVLARLAVVAGRTTALVDVDPAGGGLDVMLGIEHDPGPRWSDVLGERGGGFPPDRLMAALPAWQGVRVLSADVRGGTDPRHPVVLAAVSALTRAADAVVLDLPRALLTGSDRDLLTLCDETVLLAGCDTRSAAAAAAAAAALGPAQLVVRGPTVGNLLPEDVAAACGLPLAAVLRTERAFTAGLERGLAPGDQRRGPLVATGRRLLQPLGLAS